MALKKIEFEEEAWDKKKVLLAGLAIIVISAAAWMFFSSSWKKTSEAPRASQKAAERPAPTPQLPNLRDSVSTRIDSIKKDAQSLDVSEIATSSPQVQKIINDIKSLEGYPKSQAREICEKICSGI